MPNSARAVAKYARYAPSYDEGQDDPLPMRVAGVARLDLKPGQTVLDVGCGTGQSFALLEEAIGPGGRIIGIDLSPDMLKYAAARVERHQWRNVTLVEASATDAALPRRRTRPCSTSRTTSCGRPLRWRA